MSGERTFIIAEAGVNHNGSVALARELVHAAAEAGADAFKMQTFDADRLVLKAAPKAAYQVRNTGSDDGQYAMLKALELGAEAHFELKELCASHSIEFMSTGFDPESIAFLASKIGVRRLKIPSGEAVNGRLLLAAWRTGLPMIISTGMCTLEEVSESLSLLAWAAQAPEGLLPDRAALAEHHDKDHWIARLGQRVSLLHCITQYPAPPEATNLRALATLANATGLATGFSDHSEGCHIAVAAVAVGARIIEKHFTMSRNLAGPDHVCSLEPDELGRMVREIRDIESALGSGAKAPSEAEWVNRIPARGSLVSARAIKKGERFTLDNLTIKRPGNGISPLAYWDYVSGRVAQRNYNADEMIDG